MTTGDGSKPPERDRTIRYTKCGACGIEIAATGRGRLPLRCQKCKNDERQAKVSRPEPKPRKLKAAEQSVVTAVGFELADRDGAVLRAMKDLAGRLPSENPVAAVLFETALALALDIDETYSPTHRANAVKELRAVLADIVAPQPKEEERDDPFGLRDMSA